MIGYIGTFVQYEGLEDLVAAAAMPCRPGGASSACMIVGNENAART